MKKEDLWLLYRSRYLETKENVHLQSNLSFIFGAFPEEIGWPEDVLNDLRIRETNLKIRSSWTGNKLDRIVKSSEEVKLYYYFGWKVWEAWKSSFNTN